MKKRVLAILLALAMIAVLLPVAALANGASYASDIEALEAGMTVRVDTSSRAVYYNSLRTAVDELHSNLSGSEERMKENKITLLTDTSDKGIGVGYSSITDDTTKDNDPINITFDLNGHTFTVATGVGSSGTETNGFQLLKGSKVTFLNGTIKAQDTSVRLLIQNYCDLTLDNVTLDSREGSAISNYALSNNCGSVLIKNNTNIIPREGGTAFDLYYWPGGGYTDSVTVTFDETMTGTVQGKIEYGSDDSAEEADLLEKAVLNIKGGNFEGEFTSPKGLSNIADATINVTGGSFTSDVSAFVDTAETYATLQKGGATTHYVGSSIGTMQSLAKPGDVIEVKKGSVNLNLPAGVTVVNKSGSPITVNGDPVPTGQTVTSRIQNTDPITADLVVTRQADGSSQPVQIQVTLGRILTGSYGGHYFDHGVGVFTLQPGQSLYFHDLPANMTYDVAVLDGLVTAESNMSGTTLPNLTNSMYTNVTFAALPGVTPPEVVPGEEVIIEGEEEIITPGEEEGDVQEGTEETVPEEGEVPEEGLEELPEEGEVPTEEPVDVPKTGDSLPSIGLALMLGLAACAVVLKKARAK